MLSILCDSTRVGQDYTKRSNQRMVEIRRIRYDKCKLVRKWINCRTQYKHQISMHMSMIEIENDTNFICSVFACAY